MAGERQSELANALTYSQATPLMWAALTRNLPVIDLLVVHGADPHAINGEGANAAHWAASAGHLEVCQYLHERYGVNFLLKDKYRKTPLDYAVAYDRKDVIDWLVHTFLCISVG
jgi:ankyrin repeat protein